MQVTDEHQINTESLLLKAADFAHRLKSPALNRTPSVGAGAVTSPPQPPSASVAPAGGSSPHIASPAVRKVPSLDTSLTSPVVIAKPSPVAALLRSPSMQSPRSPPKAPAAAAFPDDAATTGNTLVSTSVEEAPTPSAVAAPTVASQSTSDAAPAAEPTSNLVQSAAPENDVPAPATASAGEAEAAPTQRTEEEPKVAKPEEIAASEPQATDAATNANGVHHTPAPTAQPAAPAEERVVEIAQSVSIAEGEHSAPSTGVVAATEVTPPAPDNGVPAPPSPASSSATGSPPKPDGGSPRQLSSRMKGSPQSQSFVTGTRRMNSMKIEPPAADPPTVRMGMPARAASWKGDGSAGSTK